MSVAISNDNNQPSPFHAGEQAMQNQAGVRKDMESIGQRVIRPFMPDQHRDFFNQLPFMIIGSVDESGWPWASVLPGMPGFVASPNPTTLILDAQPLVGDPLNTTMRADAPLGLLGIEINTRRRNRLNAHVKSLKDGKLKLTVDQSFGNCPQYIQRRSVNFIREPGEPAKDMNTEQFTKLDKAATSFIETADTFFVSSYILPSDRPEIEGVDVSHRGGKPGFVKVDSNTLTIPEYLGNYYFNTLGNFLVNPKAGLVFLDFDSGTVLQLTGTVELIDTENELIKAFDGAERGWRFTVQQGIRLNAALPFRATLEEYSPNSLIVGDWQQAENTLSVKSKQNAWRPFKVTNVHEESSVIRSIKLEPADGQVIQPFEAGQYLSIRYKPEGSDASRIRSYTVSSAPGNSHYRISVKREAQGTVSHWLHDDLKEGEVVEIKGPQGDFYIDPSETRPAALIAGGVGITPMVSMIEHIANEGIRTKHRRDLTLIHVAQTIEQRAFANRFKTIQGESYGRFSYYSVISEPNPDQHEGIDFSKSGLLNSEILSTVLTLRDYDFYLCGPPGFMQSIYNDLRELGVRDKRIFAETFGPSSLTRNPDQGNIVAAPDKEAEESLIRFAKSGFEQRWKAGNATILEVAEEQGLNPEYGCRNGSCGSCATKLVSGSVAYRAQPKASHADDEVLICCAVPALHSDKVELHL